MPSGRASSCRRTAVGRRTVILRLAGIYGPQRVPRKQDLLAGLPLAVATQGFLNLIHVEDAVQAVLAAEIRAVLPSLYVVADGCPVLRTEYYRELARLMGLPELDLTPPSDKSPAAERARGNKRVQSERARQELQLSPKVS